MVVIQPVWAQATQVTGVQLELTASGLEVILQTADGVLPQVFTSSTNQTLILDISNAQLKLPSGNELLQNNPMEGIALVTVRNLNANSIQIRVRGETGLPQIKVSESQQGLILSLTPASQTGESPSASAPEIPATQPEEGEGEITTEVEEEIEILVTGEQERGYVIPDTANVTRTNIPILNTPRSIQVVPEQVIEDQQVIRLEEALRNVIDILPRIEFGGF